jgi:hypothetical protein
MCGGMRKGAPLFLGLPMVVGVTVGTIALMSAWLYLPGRSVGRAKQWWTSCVHWSVCISCSLTALSLLLLLLLLVFAALVLLLAGNASGALHLLLLLVFAAPHWLSVCGNASGALHLLSVCCSSLAKCLLLLCC